MILSSGPFELFCRRPQAAGVLAREALTLDTQRGASEMVWTHKLCEPRYIHPSCAAGVPEAYL